MSIETLNVFARLFQNFWPGGLLVIRNETLRGIIIHPTYSQKFDPAFQWINHVRKILRSVDWILSKNLDKKSFMFLIKKVIKIWISNYQMTSVIIHAMHSACYYKRNQIKLITMFKVIKFIFCVEITQMSTIIPFPFNNDCIELK